MDVELQDAFGRVMELIEANSHQIGVLIEAMTRLEHRVEEIATIARQQNETAREQNETAKIQAQSVSALIEMLRAK
jgi:methyl-accepting chemotaxis protein